MSAPRAKRQFAGAASDPSQRQITSFFTSSPSNANYISQASPLTSIPHPPDIKPNLPASVQANLLSVGMRIRKSVPEGYKTASSNPFALWDENDADPVTAVMGEGQRSRANAFSSPRELLPFCGIHKVGGLDTQSEDHRPISYMRAGVSVVPAYYNIAGTGMGDMPGLTSSQESVMSNASSITPPRTRKRFFVEDEEEEASGQLNMWRFNPDIYSLAPVGCNNNGRAMAVPRKGRLRAKFSGATTAIPSAGQENLMVIDSDFEEAEFLDREPWEVNMNDA